MFIRLTTFAVVVAAVNVMIVAIFDGYRFALGPVHLVASALFKPLLYLNGALLVYLATSKPPQEAPTEQSGDFSWSLIDIAGALAITVVLYGASLAINLDYPDWTHRVSTEGRTPISFFTDKQPDGFYRPIAFLSLWLDSTLFASRLWCYHIQNVLLCALNGLLVMRLARRLGMSLIWARWAGLLFLLLPAGFEAVIWPGARFDLLATAFLLLSLDHALAGAVAGSCLFFGLGVLSKESAYSVPFLLLALWCFHSRLAPHVNRRRIGQALAASVALAVVLVAIRFVVYQGSFGGYPDTQPGRSVHFVLTARTLTSLFTRMPAALYLVNSTLNPTWWLKLLVCAYAGFALLAVRFRVGLGRRCPLIVLPFLALLPALNMIAWLNTSAQQARYVYQAGIWVVIALCWSLATTRRGSYLAGLLALTMAGASFFNSYAYLHMLDEVDTVARAAVLRCKTASCCRSVVLENFPGDLYGAFYFRSQVESEIQKRLPKTNVLLQMPAEPQSCQLLLTWPLPGRGN